MGPAPSAGACRQDICPAKAGAVPAPRRVSEPRRCASQSGLLQSGFRLQGAERRRGRRRRKGPRQCNWQIPDNGDFPPEMETPDGKLSRQGIPVILSSLTLPMAKARGFLVRRPQPHVTEVTRGITQSPQAYRFGRVPPYHEIALCAGGPILSDCRSWRRCAHSKSYRRRVHSSSKNSRYCGVAQQKCTRYFIPWGECEFKRQSESLPQTGYPFHPLRGVWI